MNKVEKQNIIEAFEERFKFWHIQYTIYNIQHEHSGVRHIQYEPTGDRAM